MLVRVEPVTGLGGEVDAADERDPVVDHDRLLVVAVQWPLLRIKPTLDAGVASQVGAHRAHVAP